MDVFCSCLVFGWALILILKIFNKYGNLVGNHPRVSDICRQGGIVDLKELFIVVLAERMSECEGQQWIRTEKVNLIWMLIAAKGLSAFLQMSLTSW